MVKVAMVKCDKHRWAVLTRTREGDLVGCDDCGKTEFRPALVAPIGWRDVLFVLAIVAVGGLLVWRALA